MTVRLFVEDYYKANKLKMDSRLEDIIDMIEVEASMFGINFQLSADTNKVKHLFIIGEKNTVRMFLNFNNKKKLWFKTKIFFIDMKKSAAHDLVFTNMRMALEHIRKQMHQLDR